ncbi:MAG: anthranilate synthase component I family protein [Flavobacteriaceae bacterium]|nr:anthranilate synthase component I family protein [Flavobacteriaceae bacterium]
MRIKHSYSVANPVLFKQQLLYWASQYDFCVFLDTNKHQDRFSSFDAMLAVGAFTALKTDSQKAFDQLDEYQKTTKDWLFGYLTYDLKNDVENLESKHLDGIEFPELYFIQPLKIIQLQKDKANFLYLKMIGEEISSDFKAINNLKIPEEISQKSIQLQPRISQSEYIDAIKKTLLHIGRGDIYEANFCMDFHASKININPLNTFQKLNSISQPPQACYLKFEHLHALSASPERYLKFNQGKLISQPIKGTAKRGETEEEDQALKFQLKNDPKEKSENVMIVDLVRNDLSKTAQKASVQVEELCKVYSFKQVHQMISTVTSLPKEEFSPVQLLQTSFPMGSMTGAPKVSAMQIMEKLESFKRGLYSGSIGYFDPDGNFDFNVIIRSILYNSRNKTISYAVGSAITNASIPEKEYEECLIKAKAMKEVLTN